MKTTPTSAIDAPAARAHALRSKSPVDTGGASAANLELEDHDPAQVFAAAGAASWRSCLAWVAGFFAAVYVVGLVATTVVFTAAYLRLSVKAGWRFSAVCRSHG